VRKSAFPFRAGGKDFDMVWMISGITFIVSAGIVLCIWVLSAGESAQEIVRGRIERLRVAEGLGGITTDLRLVRDEMFSTIPLLHRVLEQLPLVRRSAKYMSQAGMKTKPAKIILTCNVIAAATYIIAGIFVPYFVAFPAAILLSLIPVAVVAFKRRSRLLLFEERFPDALDMLSRAVRAGNAFPSAMQMVAQECPEPVAGEFSIAFEEQNYGIPLRDVLQHMAERVPLFDVRFLVTALNVQKDSGGNLAQILNQLATVIRERFRIRREVRTKTAMGRLTAGILMALPISMLGMMMFVNADYEGIMFHDPKGPMILGIAALMQVVGGILLWRITQIEV
jgi:tight adherence protein B